MQRVHDMRRTICWECRNTNAEKCSWFHPKAAKPVDGWKAYPTQKNGIGGQSYLVVNCPNFEPDERFDYFARGISVMEDGKTLSVDIQRNGVFYHIGEFTSPKDALLASAEAMDQLYGSVMPEDSGEDYV